MSREWVGESDSDRTFLSARCPLSGVTEYGGGGGYDMREGRWYVDRELCDYDREDDR